MALLGVELLVVAGLVTAMVLRAVGESDEFVARETLVAQQDLPAGWVPVEAAAYPYMVNSPLLRLMLEEETVAGAFSAYRNPEDSSAVASYVVFRPNAPPALQSTGDDRPLQTLAPLVAELERLARRRLDGGSPELVFTASDVPVAGSVRGRTLAPPIGDGVQSDFVLFTTGPVLALVVVEHPRSEQAFRPVEGLARLVHGRIQEQLD